MNTKETTKNLLQNILDGINDITGKEDVTLTDGVNALVSGYGQGWIELPKDMLEGLENGYDVMFYDENNMGLAFYSIKQGSTINPPYYDVKNWKTGDGTIVTFPYTPMTDIIIYASATTELDDIYNYYNIDKNVYPYFMIYSSYGNGMTRLMFGKELSKSYLGYLQFMEITHTLSTAEMSLSEIVALFKASGGTLQEINSANDYRGALNSYNCHHYANFTSNTNTDFNKTVTLVE